MRDQRGLAIDPSDDGPVLSVFDRGFEARRTMSAQDETPGLHPEVQQMKPGRTRKFTHKNRQLEVRAAPIDEGWKVRIFEQGKPVTAAVYTVAHDTAIDAHWTMKADLADTLMELAEQDVKREVVPLMPPPAETIA